MHASNLSTFKVEAERAEAQGHPQLLFKFKASLGHMTPAQEEEDRKRRSKAERGRKEGEGG